MTLTLAFYKGRGGTALHRMQDAAIRAATGGIYSHVELIPYIAGQHATATCLSASLRDGGVRKKSIALSPDAWNLVELPMSPRAPAAFIRDRVGVRSDLRRVEA